MQMRSQLALLLLFFAVLHSVLANEDMRHARWRERRRIPPHTRSHDGTHNLDNLDLYPTPEQTGARMREIFIDGKVPSRIEYVGNSTAGREVFGIRYSACREGACTDRPTVVYYGAVHGDEWVASALMVDLIEHVPRHFDTPGVQDMLAAADLVIVPFPNPDGVHQLQREIFEDVDMNRAFYPDRCGTENPYDRHGKIAEVENTKAFFQRVNPHAVLFFHAGAQVVSMPYDDDCELHHYGKEALAPDASLHSALAKGYAKLNPDMNTYKATFRDGVVNGAFWYSASGSLADWVLLNTPNVLVPLTVEVYNEKIPDFGIIARQIWPDNFEALLHFPVSIRQGVRGVVNVDDGSSPDGAGIYIMKTVPSDTTDGKTTYVHEDGSFFRPLAAGKWHVCIAKAPYRGVCTEVDVRAGTETELRVTLRK